MRRPQLGVPPTSRCRLSQGGLGRTPLWGLLQRLQMADVGASRRQPSGRLEVVWVIGAMNQELLA